jgi:hypothetical protein
MKQDFTLVTTIYNLKVSFDYESLNIHIQDSHLIQDSKTIENAIENILASVYFEKLAAAGYTRTKGSLIREWKAHNVLYRWGYEKERTGSVDLDQSESRGRRIAYFLLSLLF